MKPEYVPPPNVVRALERIKQMKFGGLEFFDLLNGISEEMKDYSKRIISNLTCFGEDKQVRYYRRELKALRWLHDQVLLLKKEWWEKKRPRRTVHSPHPILRAEPEVIPRLKKTLAKAEKRVDAKPKHKKSYKYKQAAKAARKLQGDGTPVFSEAEQQTLKPIRDHYRD